MIYPYPVRISQRTFLQNRAGQIFVFTVHICCNAPHIWQAVHHQDSSFDSRSQKVSVELVGLLHVKKWYPIGGMVLNAQSDHQVGTCTINFKRKFTPS